MSLVSSSICMLKRNIPVDVINTVIDYIGATPNARCIPRFGLDGKLCWTFNKEAFKGLSEICAYKPIIYNNFRCTPHMMVLNGVEQEHTCSSVLLLGPQLVSPNTIRTTVYASVEIAPNVCTHLSMVCDWGVGETLGVTNFHKGSLYRPYETHKWNREQRISSMDIANQVIHVDYSEITFQPEWNVELNIWEYMVYDTLPQINPYPIWVHDTEEDNIGWA